MNRLQSMTRIMMLLNQDDLLRPGSQVNKIVRQKAADMIDRLGPDEAVKHVRDHKGRLLDQIKVLHMWYRSPGRRPPSGSG